MSVKDRGVQNLHLCKFDGVGKYGIPELQPCTKINSYNFVGFNIYNTVKSRGEYGLHFYLDDYEFQRVWDKADIYIPAIKQFDSVISPDFSLYTDFPLSMQIWNHYRRMWCSAYWQVNGANVVPGICWSDEDSYSWCFDGYPRDSIVSVCSSGTIRGNVQQELFYLGFKEMEKRLHPTEILFYGVLPKWLNESDVTIIGKSGDRFDTSTQLLER